MGCLLLCAKERENVLYQLVIAEKPSVAQSLASVLGAKQRRDGYLEGNGWLVSWCVGHLAGLADADAYAPEYAKWRIDDLPILPESWRFTIAKDKREQFDVLRTLLRREDVTEIVNGCDAGREGELIFRTVYCLAGCSKPIKRLWISSMEDSAIRAGFANLKDGREYDALHQAALCRAKADWLVGINATRLFSILYHRTLNIGRVMSPTLALLVQRDAEIGAFQPEAFFTVALDCGGLTLTSERFKDKAGAEAVAAACKGQEATVKSLERKEKSEKSPALFDLTALQRAANRTLGYTAQQTLDYLQALYEKKLCTYPRTDSRYLTDDLAAAVPKLAAVSAALCGAALPEEVNAAQVCSNAKVSDHHAIIPTDGAGKADLSALPAGEREVLRLAARQLLCAVGQPHRFAETSVTAECGGCILSAKGKTVLSMGWKAYQEGEQSDTSLPELAEGQTMPVTKAVVKTGKTSPPKPYTEDTLLAAMEAAGAKDMPEDAERRGIGTPATRAATIEKLVASGFAERRKVKKATQLVPTHAGIALITVLPEQLQSPQLTAEWEHRLKQIERGEASPAEFMDSIASMLRELVKTYEAVKGAEFLFPPGEDVIGTCPRCGGQVAEKEKGYFCQSPDCRFALWKENKFFTAKRKKLTRSIAAALLKDGRAPLKDCWSERTGKTYDAVVVLEDNGEAARFKLVFGDE